MIRRTLIVVLTGAALGLPALAAPAAVSAQDLTWTGQVRPRYEHRDPVGGGPDEFTSMRVRLGLRALVDPSLTIFVQLQDVRIWGEESSTTGDFSADNLDLHQAYLRYSSRSRPWFAATVGRQETSFGGQRLVGAVDWLQQGRAFDGVRLDLDGGRTDVALVAHTLADATAATHQADAEFYGAYATVGAVGPGALDLYVLYDREEGASDADRATFGSRYAFSTAGGFSGRVEGSVQRGERSETDLSAWMVAARLGRTFAGGRGSVTLWYDYLSGDDPDDAADNAFNTLFATNHKFYGFADLFLNIPVHTGGRGLQDAALKLSLGLADDVDLGVDLHSFSAARDQGLDSGHFANELDLTLTHRYSSALSLTAGFSFVQQDDALAAVGRLAEDMTFGYVMLNATF